MEINMKYGALSYKIGQMIHLATFKPNRNGSIREQAQPRDFCTLGVAWGDWSGSGSGGTFEWVDSGKGALPKIEAWMGAWNGTVHSFTSC
jgi:hypothetical protein